MLHPHQKRPVRTYIQVVQTMVKYIKNLNLYSSHIQEPHEILRLCRKRGLYIRGYSSLAIILQIRLKTTTHVQWAQLNIVCKVWRNPSLYKKGLLLFLCYQLTFLYVMLLQGNKPEKCVLEHKIGKEAVGRGIAGESELNFSLYYRAGDEYVNLNSWAARTEQTMTIIMVQRESY